MDFHDIPAPEFAKLRDAWNGGERPKCPKCGDGTAEDYVVEENLDFWMMAFAPCGHLVRADTNK